MKRDDYHSDKLQSMGGLELKTQHIQLKDSDTEFDKHFRPFMNTVECYKLGRRNWRPVDILHYYKQWLDPKGTRY